MKCKKMVDIKGGKTVIAKKKTRMMKGKCPKCETTVCRILGKAT